MNYYQTLSTSKDSKFDRTSNKSIHKDIRNFVLCIQGKFVASYNLTSQNLLLKIVAIGQLGKFTLHFLIYKLVIVKLFQKGRLHLFY
ncbi:hypothetical protein H1P_1660004 [Hyella patelloides LEGE 07179]|uniref:Uncharacterized protein n=1 Tax=Hyella patelloides LEGE 07179 TaxID=945734 RepID=A0A563VMY7_9CYAN|nr:hypothetical protein H1P_1660004 [Hyella patelloides LEGE 07179]